ncbi:MAG: DUF502 domain-containing protein [Halolamina sp.]
MSSWKRDFASGLVIVVPVLVILFVFNWLYARLLNLPFPTITVEGLPAPAAEFLQVSLSVVLFMAFVMGVGYLMRTTAGRVAEGYLDDLINRVPLVRVLYNASKLAVETALTGTEDLQKPVKLEPWEGIRMTAFKTGKTTPDGRIVLFMPTAPNITTGFVIEVDPDDVTPTDESVEEALTRILSAGFGERDEETIPINVTEESVSADD